MEIEVDTKDLKSMVLGTSPYYDIQRELNRAIITTL